MCSDASEESNGSLLHVLEADRSTGSTGATVKHDSRSKAWRQVYTTCRIWKEQTHNPTACVQYDLYNKWILEDYWHSGTA